MMLADLWKLADARAELPPGEAAAYFEKSGITPPCPDDRRARRRFYHRTTALLQMDCQPKTMLGVYGKDLSQMGVAILSPRQLLPLQTGRLTLSESRVLRIRVRRCRRLGPNCYIVGCDFVEEEDEEDWPD